MTNRFPGTARWEGRRQVGEQAVVPEEEELPRVMREIADALGGGGAALTLHPDDRRPGRVVYADEGAGVSREDVERLLAAEALWPAPDPGDRHHWLGCGGSGPYHDALSIPVQRVAGHSRMVVSVFFERLTDEARERAERVYATRRPFAVGYFRLWQVDRANARRIRATEEALNLVGVGVAILTASGGVLFANAAARALFEEGDGLREQGGRLVAATPADTARLQAAIGHVVGAEVRDGASRSPMLALPRGGRPPLIVSVLPTTLRPEEAGDAAAALFAVDPALDVAESLRPVAKLFGMSNVEAELACRLAAGATLGEAAAALRIKEATARSYLKRIFDKTGANRQTELVRVMLSSLVRTTGGGAFEAV